MNIKWDRSCNVKGGGPGLPFRGARSVLNRSIVLPQEGLFGKVPDNGGAVTKKEGITKKIFYSRRKKTRK